MGGYHTHITLGQYGIRDCADELYGSLLIPDTAGDGPVIDKKKITFVWSQLLCFLWPLQPWTDHSVHDAARSKDTCTVHSSKGPTEMLKPLDRARRSMATLSQ